jgi:hypothetical protein
MDKTSFRMPWFYRPGAIVLYVRFLAMAVALLVATANGAKQIPTMWFLGPWLVWGCVSGYLLLFRFCYRLELADGALHWFAPVRSGWLPVTEIRGARPAFEWMYRSRLKYLDRSTRYDRNFEFAEAIDRAAGKPLLVLVTRWNSNRLAYFLDDVQKYVPDAPMRYGQS